ncbi:MAG: hypothetical protein ACOYOT_09475 [Bacteroidales bacterium]
MKKSFEFLYYCLYRMFTLIKRVGEKDENLASSFFSILLSTTTITLFFPLRFIIPKGFFTPRPYDVLIKITLGSIFIIWYFICKYYFLKKENHVRIIASYEEIYLGKNKSMALLGIIYSLVTFVSFIFFAIWVSRIIYQIW